MNTIIQEKDFQATGYTNAFIMIRPDPSTYYGGFPQMCSSDDASFSTLLDEVIRKYPHVWDRLSKM